MKAAFLFFVLCLFSLDLRGADSPTMTHGPMLGKPTSNSMRVWARTSEPSEFEVRFGTSKLDLSSSARSAVTSWEHDCAGFVDLRLPTENTRYFYQVFMNGLPQGEPGSFNRYPIRPVVAILSTIRKDYLIFVSKSVAAPIRIRKTGSDIRYRSITR